MKKPTVNLRSPGNPVARKSSSTSNSGASSPSSLSPAPRTRKSASRNHYEGGELLALSPSGGSSSSSSGGGGLSAATHALLMSKGQSCSGYLHKLPVDRSALQAAGAAPAAAGGVGASGGASGSKSGKLPSNSRNARRGTDLTRRWTKRWFTLRGSTLEYRSSKDSKTAKGSLVLSDGSICSEVDNSKSVFEIWTFNGTVLLRADSEVDKQRWFRALRSVCKIRTMTDQGLTDNSPQKQKHGNLSAPTGAGGAGKLAQKPLVDYRRRKAMLKVASGTFLLLLPQIVRDLVDWLIKYGLDHEGLFRVSADAVAISKLLQDYHDREADGDRVRALLDGLDGNTQVDLVADTLKKFLRALPEPLAPTVHYRPLLAIAVDCDQEPERVLPRVVDELQKMNRTHCHALLYLLGFCSTLTSSSGTNKMKPYNIAVCLAPTILCDRTSESTGVSALVEMPRVLKIVEFLIVHLDEIVSQLEGLEKTVDDAEMQAALQNLKATKGQASASATKVTAAASQQSALGRASSKVGNVCVQSFGLVNALP
eukprot:INCI5917.4.p1 GENE.INCI5917.4~~INCI5917.4.p1  ORF type:complete len:538 (-),score=87.16 INCI5917.4:250-1863(-)